ncbi:hypothetical protein BDN70DRAFT_774566, partial [Pholiota conissans]
AVQIYARLYYDKTPNHTSILTGEMWVTELLNGHLDCIKSALGIRVLYALSSTPFYTIYVWLLSIDDPIPSEIATNPKFFPFFQNAIGAIDGTQLLFRP